MKKFGNCLIIGDSYSTYEGCVPAGNACYYIKNGRPETDLTDVKDTWWKRLMDDTSSNLVLNESYSGSTVCHTGYNGRDFINVSFLGRTENLVKKGFFDKNEIDTVFVFGLTNDYWAGAPLGEVDYGEKKTEDCYKVFPALCALFELLKNNTTADIYFITNTELSPAMAETVPEICAHYGICDIVLTQIDKRYGHPTVAGMKDIEKGVLAATQK